MALTFLTGVAGCGRNGEATVSSQKAPPPPAADSPFKLVEVAKERGIDFRHTVGSRTPLSIVETMGSGVAVFDYDGDGWMDLFFVNAGQDFQKTRQTPGSRLYHNRGDGSFEDVTGASGIVVTEYAMGCCAGDYDNDGKEDLFVSGYGGNRLFHNLGGGRFEDVTEKAGLLRRPGAWGMGCAFVDVNRDGLPDLYVANYVRYDPAVPFCKTNEVLHGCTPNQYKTQANELYINLGGGRFAEKAAALGADDVKGAGLGVVVADFDNDGWPDIFVANDGTPNALLHNLHGRFEDLGQRAGVAFSEDGAMRAGMGTDAADFDGDGLPDLVITNFQHEPNSLYHNGGKLLFQEVTYAAGIGTPTLNRLSFGVAFGDLDCDGRQDLYVGNGHVYDNVAQFDDTTSFELVDQVFLNRGAQFIEALPSTGAIPNVASVARGVALGDFNNDGALDVAVNSVGRPARLLENRTSGRGHWFGLKLEGAAGNRDAIGARVELRDTKGKLPLQVREVRSGGSYLCQPDMRALFDLPAGAGASGLKLTVRWPNGKSQPLPLPPLDRYTNVREAKQQ